MFNQRDLEVFKNRHISVEEAESQMRRFQTGFPFLKLADSARVGKGIHRLNKAEEEDAIASWQAFLAEGKEVTKFVPASGAASRMFKALYSFVAGDEEQAPQGSPVAELLANLDKLPFIDELNQTTLKIYGKPAHDLLKDGQQKYIIKSIIEPWAMNYGNLPKALLTFHKYPDCVRTPLEEQIREGMQTAVSQEQARFAFTVSPAHSDAFNKMVNDIMPRVSKEYHTGASITISTQAPSTDTIAATLDNEPFRDENGDIVFRPGGHGSLISNLQGIKTPVVFVKNIDNVVPETHREISNHYKKVIAGVLVTAQKEVCAGIKLLQSGKYTEDNLQNLVAMLRSKFCIEAPQFDSLKGAELADYLLKKLNRPIRVCGMVKNDGEPGGGPFLAYNSDGSISPQILESTQIDPDNKEYAQMLKNSTHFNPVDLVCYINDANGEKFNLPDYVDESTGFISSKSFGARQLRALERPGLWNGAMSDWLSIFVEVPLATFNPVKTVNDLLRPAHQV